MLQIDRWLQAADKPPAYAISNVELLNEIIMKKALLLLLLTASTITCCAQHKQNEKQKQITATEDNKPRVSWKVNKKYDDKGNLVGYDSSYSWTYSARGGKVCSVAADSVMEAFKKQFNTEFPVFFNKSFGDPIWSDSLFYQDFPTADYFMKKWDDHYFDIRGMMRQMDSLRNSFLKTIILD